MKGLELLKKEFFLHKKQFFFSILLIIGLSCSLISTRQFLSQGLGPFYYSQFCIGLFILSSSSFFIINITKCNVQLSNGVLALLVWCLYLTFNLQIGPSWEFKTSYLLCYSIFIFACYASFKTNLVSIYFISEGFLLIGLIESIFCICQAMDLIPSKNSLFTVTGTWFNPNVTSMFLAITFPLILIKTNNKNKKGKIFFSIIFLIGLYLLKCRTGIIGVSWVLLSFATSRYKLIDKFRNLTLSLKFTFLITALAVFLVSVYGLYKIKEDSSNSRFLIWKISMRMITEKPIMGFGYGNYEVVYNLAQAKYFSNGEATTKDRNVASFTKMAYNEYLQCLVEGGVLGSLFMLSITLTIICNKHITNHTYYRPIFTGFLTFLIMSFFNFTIDAIPVFFVFSIYVGFLLANQKVVYILNVKQGLSVAFIMLFLGIRFAFSISNKISAQSKLKKVQALINHHKIFHAQSLLTQISSTLKESPGFYITQAHSYLASNDIQSAINSLASAQIFTSHPDVIRQKAECFEKLKDYEKAIDCYRLMSNIEPAKLEPHYKMMLLYNQMLNKTAARKEAELLISMKPKGISLKAVEYKNQAHLLLAR